MNDGLIFPHVSIPSRQTRAGPTLHVQRMHEPLAPRLWYPSFSRAYVAATLRIAKMGGESCRYAMLPGPSGVERASRARRAVRVARLRRGPRRASPL